MFEKTVWSCQLFLVTYCNIAILIYGTLVKCRGVTKRCRLSWLTHSALVYAPKRWRGGGAVVRAWVQLCTWSPNKLWRSNSIFNMWLNVNFFICHQTGAKRLRDTVYKKMHLVPAVFMLSNQTNATAAFLHLDQPESEGERKYFHRLWCFLASDSGTAQEQWTTSLFFSFYGT